MASVKVKSVERVSCGDVYDISVVDAEHYILGNGIVTHNSGAKYAADTIVFLSKAKEKDDEKHLVGNVITATMQKSRLTREGLKVQTRVMFSGGLDKYYGLLAVAVDAGVVTKVGTKYRFPGTESAFFEKAILKAPEKFFTPEVLKQIDAYVQKSFVYSATSLAERADSGYTEDVDE